MAKEDGDSNYGDFLQDIFSSLSMEDEVGSVKAEEMKVLNEISPVEELENKNEICQTCNKRPAESPLDELANPHGKRLPDSDLPNNPKRLKKSSCKCKKQLTFLTESEMLKHCPEYPTSEDDEDDEKLAQPLSLEELNITTSTEGHAIAATNSENETPPETGSFKRKHSSDSENWIISEKKLKVFCNCKNKLHQNEIKEELENYSECNFSRVCSESGLPRSLPTCISTGVDEHEAIEGLLKLKEGCHKLEGKTEPCTQVDKCLGSKHIKREVLELVDLESDNESSSKSNKTTELQYDNDLLNLLPDCGDVSGNKKCHHHNKDSLAVLKERSKKTKYSGVELQMIQEEDEIKSAASSQVETVKKRIPSYPIVNNFFKEQKGSPDQF